MHSATHDTIEATEKMTDALSVPALLGGPAVNPAGPPSWPPARPDVLAALEQCFRSGDWGRYNGENVPGLQLDLATLHEAEHVLLCSSGTAAVELALRGLLVGPGDEVILAGYDFKGNFQNILAVGATPVLVDIAPRTGQLDPERVQDAVTSSTRAIIASHLHGGVVNMQALQRVIEGSQIAVIEDACQMPGAQLGERRAGMRGDVGVISFGGSKLLSAGRGGAVLTNRDDVSARIRRYQWRGNDAYPLSELQAAVLRPQVATLDQLRDRRRQGVKTLYERLTEFPWLTPLAPPNPDVEADYYKVGFRYDAATCGVSRDLFAAAMRAEGIAISPSFRALHRIHARSRFRQADDLVNASRADEEWLVLHHPVLLDGAAAVEAIITAALKIHHFADELNAADLPLTTAASFWEYET